MEQYPVDHFSLGHQYLFWQPNSNIALYTSLVRIRPLKCKVPDLSLDIGKPISSEDRFNAEYPQNRW